MSETAAALETLSVTPSPPSGTAPSTGSPRKEKAATAASAASPVVSPVKAEDGPLPDINTPEADAAPDVLPVETPAASTEAPAPEAPAPEAPAPEAPAPEAPAPEAPAASAAAAAPGSIDRSSIGKNANGSVEPSSADPELWNIDGCEVDMLVKYKMGGNLWYVQSRMRENPPAKPIPGFPMNDKAVAAKRFFSKEEEGDFNEGSENHCGGAEWKVIEAANPPVAV